jgi:hypothetical protein
MAELQRSQPGCSAWSNSTGSAGAFGDVASPSFDPSWRLVRPQRLIPRVSQRGDRPFDRVHVRATARVAFASPHPPGSRPLGPAGQQRGGELPSLLTVPGKSRIGKSLMAEAFHWLLLLGQAAGASRWPPRPQGGPV